jgi:hypothetical protein
MTTERKTEKMSEQCISYRCWSPVACGGFGYCRLRNFGAATNTDNFLFIVKKVDAAHAEWISGKMNNPRFAHIVGDEWPKISAALRAAHPAKEG